MLSTRSHVLRTGMVLATGFLVSILASSAYAIPFSVNVRDHLLASQGRSYEPSLEEILTEMTDYSGGFGQADQSVNALFSPLKGAPVAGLVIERAGYRDVNELGIYNLDGVMATLFDGPAGAGSEVELIFSGDQISVDGAILADFGTTFGFYISNQEAGFTWFSQDILNPGDRAHFLAFEEGNSLYFGFEDLDLGDRDYNDLVAKVTGIRGAIPTPEPAATLVFAAGALVVWVSTRRRIRSL